MVTRREAILKHIARYGITLRPVLERILSPDNSPPVGADLDRLIKEELVQVKENAVADIDQPQTKYSYYFLTRKACKLIGAPDSRARTPGPGALNKTLAVLWYCCMLSRRSHVLFDFELAEIFCPGAETEVGKRSAKPLPGTHCVTCGPDFLQVQNLYAPNATPGDTLSHLSKSIRKAREVSAVAKAISTRQFIFTLLVETQEKRNELRKYLSERLGDQGVVFNVFRSPGTWRVKERSGD